MKQKSENQEEKKCENLCNGETNGESMQNGVAENGVNGLNSSSSEQNTSTEEEQKNENIVEVEHAGEVLIVSLILVVVSLNICYICSKNSESSALEFRENLGRNVFRVLTVVITS